MRHQRSSRTKALPCVCAWHGIHVSFRLSPSLPESWRLARNGILTPHLLLDYWFVFFNRVAFIFDSSTAEWGYKISIVVYVGAHSRNTRPLSIYARMCVIKYAAHAQTDTFSAKFSGRFQTECVLYFCYVLPLSVYPFLCLTRTSGGCAARAQCRALP